MNTAGDDCDAQQKYIVDDGSLTNLLHGAVFIVDCDATIAYVSLNISTFIGLTQVK